MNTAQIIVVKPEYIAQSFEWYIDDELKKNIDEDNRLLLENAKKNYCSGKMSVCSVEMLEKLDVVFLGNDKKIVPSFDDVFIRNPYDTNQFFLASCAIERIQRARFDKYKLFLQKLGAKRILKKIDKMESSEENDKVGVKLKSDNRGAQKTTEKNDNKTSKGAVDINIVKEIKEVFKEDYWEDLSFCSENDGSVFTREQWGNAKNFLMQNNLQFDDDFLTMLEFRNPSTNMNLLKRFANHYHCKKDMSTIFDLGVSVDIAKIALGFNPATKILSSFLKLSVNIDFHYRKEITRIAEQSIDVEVEF